MPTLGRRRHPRYLLHQPVEGNVRVRDEVTIVSLGDREIVVVSPEACRPDENVSLEIPNSGRFRVNAKVAESRPLVAEDGAIRHRLRLVPSSGGIEAAAAAEERR